MRRIFLRFTEMGAACWIILAMFAGLDNASADALTQISVSRLTLPGAITAIVDVIKAKGFDRKHGIDLVVKNYSSISAFYAATFTGEVDMSVSGPWVLQKANLGGSKTRAVFTLNRISSLGVVTANPKINVIGDLKGKSLAADMGSAEYQLLAMYAKSEGLILGKDVTVVQASPVLAGSQLSAGRVDAAMSWETNTTVLLRSNSAYRRIIGGETAWEKLTGSKDLGWQLLITMDADAIVKHENAIPNLLAMWQDAARFITDHTDEAAQIDVKMTNLPNGILQDSVGSKRLVYEIHPVWEKERANIWSTFKMAVDNGYIDRLPSPDILYAP